MLIEWPRRPPCPRDSMKLIDLVLKKNKASLQRRNCFARVGGECMCPGGGGRWPGEGGTRCLLGGALCPVLFDPPLLCFQRRHRIRQHLFRVRVRRRHGFSVFPVLTRDPQRSRPCNSIGCHRPSHAFARGGPGIGGGGRVPGCRACLWACHGTIAAAHVL